LPSWKKILDNNDWYPTFESEIIIIRRIRMNITGIAYIVCFYVLVASGETLNGIARTVFLNKRIGVVRAKRVSMLSGLLICLLICYLYIPQMGINSDSGLYIRDFAGYGMGLSAVGFFDTGQMTRHGTSIKMEEAKWKKQEKNRARSMRN